jgi:hypothetical protein
MLRPRPAQESPPPALPPGAPYLRLVEVETLDERLRRMIEACPTTPELESFVLRLGQEPRA